MEKLKLSELTIDSREVAQMIGKRHTDLLRDVKRYIEYMKESNERKIASVDFFKESTYIDDKNERRPCYEVTKKGCEFIGHKLTGKKGVLFTASYINRFHEMEEELKNPKPKEPWFVRDFNGNKIILERDFIDITGIDIKKHKLFYRPEYFTGGRDWNGWGWKCDNEEFKAEYGFDYGNDDCMIYFYPHGVIKALDILSQDKKIKMNEGAKELILSGINETEFINVNKTIEPKSKTIEKALKYDMPIQICIRLGENERSLIV